jgi:RHS repeat-associated protein
LVGSSWQTNFYGFDGHGSVRLLTTTAGAVSDSCAYEAFGTLIDHTGSTPNNFLYSGEQLDSNLGFYYQRARYYSPQIGRFWTMDSQEGDQEDPQSLHRFSYCRDEPVDRIDPTGHMDEACYLPDVVFNWIDLRILQDKVQGLEVITVPRTGGYDPTGKQVAALRFARRTGCTVLSVRTVADANSQLRSLPKPIRVLHIEGHGAGTGQRVGPNNTEDQCFFVRAGSDGRPEFKNVLEMFQGIRFTRTAQIWLRGCRVAGDPALWKLLKREIAEVARVRESNVHAFESDMRVWGDYGLSQPDEGLPQ